MGRLGWPSPVAKLSGCQGPRAPPSRRDGAEAISTPRRLSAHLKSTTDRFLVFSPLMHGGHGAIIDSGPQAHLVGSGDALWLFAALFLHEHGVMMKGLGKAASF